MGIFNCAETLPDAIGSIVEQTYKNWEIILCDDGSTDDTYAVALELQSQSPEKIIVLQNEQNLGLNLTLNRCLQFADGDYIARMDGDDLSLPERLEKETAFLDANPEYAIVSCPMIYFDENGVWGTGKAVERPEPKDFIAGTPFCHAPCMVRREAFEAVGGYSIDKRTLRAEDYDLWFRMYEKGYRGYNLQEPLYKMRDDQNALRRRKLRFACHEAYVRKTGYRRLGLPRIYDIFILRPVLVALLPKPVYMLLHHRKRQ